MMTKECSESSVATSSSTPQNWWDLHHASSALSSWTDNTSTSPWQHQTPNSNSSCEEEVSISAATSFTYPSANHSGHTVDSCQRFLDQPSAASNELIGDHAPDNHLWNHVFLNVGDNGELQNSGENLLDHALSSKSMYEPPAYDYLKKMDNNWEFTNSTSFSNSFGKHMNGFAHHESLTNTAAAAAATENERLNKLSNLVSHWSIAPPRPEINRHGGCLDSQTCSISLSDQYSHATGTIRNPGLLSYYGQDLKAENEHHGDGSIFRRSFNDNGIGYQGGLINNGSMMEDGHDHDSKYFYGISNSPCTSSHRNFADSSTALSSRVTKPLIDIQVPINKPYFKSVNLSDSKKHGLRNSSATTINGRERGFTNEGKKKRSEETSESVPKKPKNESSTASSVKQAPKVKLADKITALQQIVSPFGKTDTASVLYEAIGYIKFLQEQVQLLSNPYMKCNSHKDPWGGLERKEKGDMKVDLRSRGLCLVPISCTPKAYHENTGSDYWTPAYRGCLYR